MTSELRTTDSCLDLVPPGQYRLRLVVKGLDANYLQEPTEVAFAIGNVRSSNLPEVMVTEPLVSNDVLQIRGETPLIGTVRVPEGSLFYKVEVKDNLARDQAPRFTDWSMIGTTHAESVVEGWIEVLPGPDQLPNGNYLLRIVIVNPNGTFSGEPYQVQLRVQAPTVEMFDPRNTELEQVSGGTAEFPVVITQPRLNIRRDGTVQTPRLPTNEPIRVSGTAVLPADGSYWKLEVLGEAFTDWTTINTTHTNSVRNGELTTLLASALPPGSYRLRLVIVGPDASFVGTPSETPITVTG